MPREKHLSCLIWESLAGILAALWTHFRVILLLWLVDALFGCCSQDFCPLSWRSAATPQPSGKLFRCQRSFANPTYFLTRITWRWAFQRFLLGVKSRSGILESSTLRGGVKSTQTLGQQVQFCFRSTAPLWPQLLEQWMIFSTHLKIKYAVCKSTTYC